MDPIWVRDAGVASWLETFDVGPAAPVAVVPSAGEKAAVAAEVAETPAAAELAAAPQALSPAVTVQAGEAPVSVELQTDDTVPQQIGRTVGRAATKAADLLANLPTLPKFGRKR